MGTDIPEQALVLEAAPGNVVITGCAHPGIVEIVRRARELHGPEVHMVLGGFHLGWTSESEIRTIIAELRDLGVDKVGPSHCTGDLAIRLFREEYGDDFVELGTGRVVVVD
jgi:7,8-dihydropterin-6-yl-methyl-4-(beta-D-ribofuranosyl)aminobenzene 5'-phosphate synthase